MFGSQQNKEYEIFARSLFEMFYDSKAMATKLGISEMMQFVNPFRGKRLLLSIALEPMENMAQRKSFLKKLKDETGNRFIKFF